MSAVGEIVDSFPTHDRKGNPVVPSGHIRERWAATDYCSRYRPGLPPDEVYSYYLWAAGPDTRRAFEEKADRQLFYLDHQGVEITDREREW